MAATGKRVAGPVWSGRALEWAILLAVLLLLVAAYGRQVQNLQAQAEFAAVQTTLGALRTSLVVDHLRTQLRPATASTGVQRNPFQVLETPPANYAGVVAMSDLAGVAPGSWVFDAECVCVGYRPQNPQWFNSAVAVTAMWFRVSSPPGVLQLTPLEPYSWQGQPIN